MVKTKRHSAMVKRCYRVLFAVTYVGLYVILRDEEQLERYYGSCIEYISEKNILVFFQTQCIMLIGSSVLIDKFKSLLVINVVSLDMMSCWWYIPSLCLLLLVFLNVSSIISMMNKVEYIPITQWTDYSVASKQEHRNFQQMTLLSSCV